MAALTYRERKFYWHGEPHQILSGAIHYFRIPRRDWRHRLECLKALGFNCVETYVPWNLHERERGLFDFSGELDLCHFLALAAELDLHVIFRPGPYICAEWDFGGLPAYLLAELEAEELRHASPRFLAAVEVYFSELIPRIRPYLETAGGPIIAVQVENEYGSFSEDPAYLSALRDLLIRLGIDVLLFTSDGGTETMLRQGTLPDVLATVNFGSDPDSNFAALAAHQPEAPPMVMEFWCGWFDHYGERHHVRDPQETVETVISMIESGASLNLYMFAGASNFGFHNGANHADVYQPTITSYDYDAFIHEDGRFSEKYLRLRDYMSKHSPDPLPELPREPRFIAPAPCRLAESADFWQALDTLAPEPIDAKPKTMEAYGQSQGLILYRFELELAAGSYCIDLGDFADLAMIYLDHKLLASLGRNGASQFEFERHEGGSLTLDILIENFGHINYGAKLYDPKGLRAGLRLDGQGLETALVYLLPLEQLRGADLAEVFHLSSAPVHDAQPHFVDVLPVLQGADLPQTQRQPRIHRGYFSLESTGSTYLDLSSYEIAQVYVNGFNLGRLASSSAARRLYLPEAYLKTGDNEVLVFERYARPEAEVIAVNFYLEQAYICADELLQ
ncbi:MAG: beta-galactosidase [Eubacteriales bacterium]|nr:beta-galactosidase [Eubacteriales bacterium]